MAKRDLGREGENAFSGWCNHAGFSCNKSLDNDKFGWDFLVEFASEYSDNLPVDSQLPPIECKVQVKATQGYGQRVQIKVSALYRLVKYSNPAFICFIEYGFGHVPERAYLVHVDQNIIAKVLKRVRELESKGKGDKLHNSKITINYRDEHKISSLDGIGIKHKILEYVPQGMFKYTENKIHCVSKVGNPGYKLTTKFDSNDIDAFQDVFLGLKETVFIKEVKAFSSRFDIDLPNRDKTCEHGAILTIPSLQPTYKHKLLFKKSKYTSGVEFDADVYLTPLGAQFNDSQGKVRITSDIVELISDGNELIFTLKFNDKEIIKLSQLKKHMTLMKLITTNTSFVCEIRDTHGQLVYDHEVSTQGKALGYPTEIFDIFDQALKVCHLFGVEYDDVSTNLISILGKSDSISLLLYTIEMDASEITWTNDGSNVPAPEESALVSIPTTMVGDYAFGSIVSFKNQKGSDGNTVFEKEIVQHYCGPYERLKSTPILEHVKEYEKQLNNEGLKMYTVSFEKSKPPELV